MTPDDLAAYIARGVSALPAFDLPAILDALRRERTAARAQIGDSLPTPAALAVVRRLDAAIAEVEYLLDPCLINARRAHSRALAAARSQLAFLLDEEPTSC